MKVTIAIDSFKESATSSALAYAIQSGIEDLVETVTPIPISDGGEGTIEAISTALSGELRTIKTVNSFGEDIHAEYFLTTIDGHLTAVIESSSIVGIHFSNHRKDRAYLANSYGLGLMISEIIESGVKRLIITLGGSGTTDGGLGMLQGLGATLFDSENKQLIFDYSNPLLSTHHLSLNSLNEKLAGIHLIIANDVQTPYCGTKGAAYIFGPQKGLSNEQVALLDKKLEHIADSMLDQGYADLKITPGAGAAGGLGGAFALLNAEMQSGFSLVADLVGLEEQLRRSDWVITGEGKLDAQSSAGKVPYGVANLAKKYGKRTLLLCGSYEEIPKQPLFDGIFSIQHEPVSLQQAMDTTYTLKNIEQLSRQIFQLICLTE